MSKGGSSYFHRGGRDALLGATIPEHVAMVAKRFPEREAVVGVPQNRRLNYRALLSAVDELARGLLGLGYGKGDRIGIWATNNIEWLLLQLATARIGVVLVNINPAYRSRELEHALQRADVQALFMIARFRSSDYVAILTELIPQLHASSNALPVEAFPALKHVVVYDTSQPMQSERPAPGMMVWQEVIDLGRGVDTQALDRATAGLDRDDTINIQFTSGTTGFPKAVMLSHHNILNNAWFSALAMHFCETDRLCVPVPFYHCFGMVLANVLCLSVGACIVIAAEHFDALAVLRAIAREKCTAVHGVPTMFVAQLEHPRFAEFDLSGLRTGIMAGAPCPTALMQRVMQQMHCREILIGYGQTEASPITHLTTREDRIERRIETVGRNLPHQEVKVVHPETGATVALGEIGEICFRGYHVMQGYYADPEATRKTIDPHGWLHSGDLGSQDEDGYVRITGRLKDMIIRGGENIYPREIEDYLFTHPKIAEVAVIGVPDDFYGEELMAWIKPHAGVDLTEKEVRDFCHGKIAHYKVPKYIWFVHAFPMTVTGKVQKYKMREEAMQQLAKPA